MIILLLVSSYLLGNILTGAVIGRFFYKEEIRAKGSGNPGARNVGRLYGKTAFVFTFLGDAAKGVIAVWGTRFFGFDSTIELFMLFAVIVGHIFPILFKFQGGKGISTFIGGLLLFDPFAFVLFVGIFVILYPFFKSFTNAGLCAILLYPFLLFLLSYKASSIIIACLIAGLILFAHSENVRGKFLRKREWSS